jgi:hypothetical protein
MTDAVDWIENRLEVTGPDQALREFVMAAEGPGFVAWERPAGEDLRYWSALALQGGAPSSSAADKLARRLEDKIWCTIEDARSAAERGLISVPLDLNALIPVPWKILRRGWHGAGSEWCWEHCPYWHDVATRGLAPLDRAPALKKRRTQPFWAGRRQRSSKIRGAASETA